MSATRTSELSAQRDDLLSSMLQLCADSEPRYAIGSALHWRQISGARPARNRGQPAGGFAISNVSIGVDCRGRGGTPLSCIGSRHLGCGDSVVSDRN